MKKLLLPLFLTILLTLSLVPTSYAANETEDIISYLSGKTIKTGSSSTNYLGSTTAVTDGDYQTWHNIKAGVSNTAIPDYLIYEFETPVSINAFKIFIKDYDNQVFTYRLLDSKENVIYSVEGEIIPGDAGIYSLPTTYDNVKKVVLFNRSTVNLDVIEWDMYLKQTITEPEPEPNGDRAILTIIMTTGLQKEFDLSMREVNDFIDWYDTKENGIGPAHYGINKHYNNKGPFSKRVDYVVFKNILSFEVSEYSTATSATYLH
ncbi:hypothetical protein [Paenibacillus motobuensis]|uniref:F5/8 type C domain-containing protein n=1 Tax=Paenibacillus motobuensis TaxID=295324 RepID=A0ABN0XUB3_9BACL